MTAHPQTCPNEKHAFVFSIGTLIVLVAGAAAQGPAPSPAPRDAAEQHVRSAQTYQLAGDYEKAAAEYREAIARGLQHLGNLRVSQGKQAEGIDLLGTAVKIEPAYADAAIDLAIAHFQSGSLEKSRPVVDEVLKQDPQNVRALNLMGKICFMEGDYQNAADHLQAALRLEPDFEVAYSLALSYLKLKKVADATSLFDEMLASTKSSAEMHGLVGIAYRETGYLDQSIDHFTKAISLDARHPHTHSSLALAYMGQGAEKYPEAGREFEAELAIDPDDYASHYFLGVIRLREHKLADAEKWFDQATKLRPADPDAFFSIGQVYVEEGAFEKAVPALQKSVSLTKDQDHDSQIAQAHEMLSQAFHKLGNDAESASERVRADEARSQKPGPKGGTDSVTSQVGSSGEQELHAVLMKPTTGAVADSPAEAEYVKSVSAWLGEAYHNLGVIDAMAGRFQEAAAEFKQAARWNPTIEALDRNWGIAAFRANLHADAIAPLERTWQRKPDDMRVREMLGLCYFMTNKFVESAKVLGPIADQLPNDPALLYAAGVSLVRTGNVTQAGKVFTRMLEQNQNVPEVHLMLGKAYSEQKEYEQALAEIARALELNPKLGEAHYQAGMVYFKQGKLEDAVREFQAELGLNTQYVPAMYRLASVRITQHENDEAIHLLTAVIAQEPSYADAYYELGKAMLEKGELKEAVQNLETSVRLQPSDTYSYYQLSLAYRRQGRIDEAQQALERYQQLKEKQQSVGNPQQ
jgi:tetratricopeptide (TPR) repeat protein